MSIRVFLLCLALLGCPKKSNPEFFQAKADYEILVARHGDDAFGMSEMTAVETVLKAIPSGSEEHAPAAALLGTIAGERARIAEAERALDAPSGSDVSAPTTGYWEAQNKPADTRAVEPEAKTKLVTGLPEAEFRKAFGRCVDFKGAAEVPPDGTKGTVFEGVNSADCRALLEAPAEGKVQYFFVAGKFSRWMQSVETRTRQILDGGTFTEVTVVDAGQPGFVLPGMPVPDGYPAVPGQPSGLQPGQ